MFGPKEVIVVSKAAAATNFYLEHIKLTLNVRTLLQLWILCSEYDAVSSVGIICLLWIRSNEEPEAGLLNKSSNRFDKITTVSTIPEFI
jgi:hypothetical protein